jgi:hypothetical protein
MPGPDTGDPVALAGVVVYRRRAAGGLDAEWRSQRGSGIGLATGGPLVGFAGQYRVVYGDQDGGDDDIFDLTITPQDSGFRLTWSVSGATLFAGVGIQLDDNTLVASYTRAGEKDIGPDERHPG